LPTSPESEMHKKLHQKENQRPEYS